MIKGVTTDSGHTYRHVRRNGVVVYVTKQHRDRLYRRGDMPPAYKLPAIIYDVMFRTMVIAIWRHYDGPDGERYIVEVTWWHPSLSGKLS